MTQHPRPPLFLNGLAAQQGADAHGPGDNVRFKLDMLAIQQNIAASTPLDREILGPASTLEAALERSRALAEPYADISRTPSRTPTMVEMLGPAAIVADITGPGIGE